VPICDYQLSDTVIVGTSEWFCEQKLRQITHSSDERSVVGAYALPRSAQHPLEHAVKSACEDDELACFRVVSDEYPAQSEGL